MSRVPDDVGTFLRVWEVDGSAFSCLASDEPQIDAAVTRWIETNRTVDTLLYITLTEGDVYRTLASRITGWRISTPEGRARSCALEAMSRDEERANRTAAGLPWEDEE